MEEKVTFVARALEAADKARGEGAPIMPNIAAAQASLESRYGRSLLAMDAFNYFGVKAGKSWTGPTLDLTTTEIVNGHPVTVLAHWRKYVSPVECFRDYGNIIETRSWFADAAAAARRNDAVGFLRGLIFDPHGSGAADDESGWATDESYFEKVMAVAQRWSLV